MWDAAIELKIIRKMKMGEFGKAAYLMWDASSEIIARENERIKSEKCRKL